MKEVVFLAIKIPRDPETLVEKSVWDLTEFPPKRIYIIRLLLDLNFCFAVAIKDKFIFYDVLKV